MIMPLVATLVGVPAVDVSPLNCAGPNACDIVSVYTSVFWIAMAVLVIVGGLIVYAALRFRRRDDKEPAQTHGNPRLEVLWTAIPVLIVGFVFIRTTLRMDYVRNGPAPQQVIQVGVQVIEEDGIHEYTANLRERRSWHRTLDLLARRG